jgi:checkpoint serine/threonine-protein kinase
MAIFSDANNDRPQPTAGAEAKGWDSIGSLHERKKENAIAARPWAGETLKAGKRVGTEPKMAIFKDQVCLPIAGTQLNSLRLQYRTN